MQMTIREFSSRFPNRVPPIPAEYAGQWVAWNEDRSEILAHGNSLGEARNGAVEAGCSQPVLQKIPRAPFVGGA